MRSAHVDRRVRLLAVAVLVDVACAVVIRLAVALDFPFRSGPWLEGLAWLALAWLAVLVAALVNTVRYVHSLDVELARRHDVIDAYSASREWIWQATPDLVWTYCNDRVRELLGYRAEDLVGRSMLDVVAPEDIQLVRSTVADAIAGDHGWDDIEMCWQHADGRLVRLEGSATPVRDGKGRLIGFRGSRRRISAAQSADLELAASASRIDRVLADNSGRIALQPVVSLSSGRLVAVESLARFPDNRTPDRWFNEARRIGRGIDLELAMTAAALKTLDRLPPWCRLSLNASPELILDQRFADLLTAATPLDRICLEITEHVAIERYDDIHQALLPLRERGASLAVDDAGAGYASFHHVLRLRPDTIKLDRSLITRIDTDPARRALITAMVLVALELQASVTAEGVETRAELETLTTLGVDAAQGYLLARPHTDPARWHSWLERRWSVLQPEREPMGLAEVGADE
ncbi:MAG TPA: EAL domain-containing protein [Mycobacteriales bacterium]|nr:EAL domain-containing protein [Mycobacteriales bacterium]